MKAVGNFSVKATDALGMKNFILNSGDYYIQVKNTTAKGNVGFELTIDGDNANDDKCFIAKADPEYNDTAASAVTVDVSAGESITDGWVGLSDEYDYFKVEVDDSGSKYYNINFANSDAAQLTLYVVNPSTGKTSVVKLDVNDMANLTAGDYFLTSTELIQIDSQDNINKLITIA